MSLTRYNGDMGPDRSAGPGQDRAGWVLGAALLLLALNLRPAVAAVSPVLGEIRHTTGLSSTGAGVLTTVPLLAFAAFAAVTPWLERRSGTRGLLLGAMVGVVVGSAVRLMPGAPALFGGTVVIGAGIAVANAALPGLVKAEFRQRADLMTGLYTMMLSAGAALAAGTTVPIRDALGTGWRPAVAVWGLLALVAAAVWIPHTRRPPRSDQDVAVAGLAVSPSLWRDGLAWSVTAFMGLQSLSFYAALSWVPTIFADHGISAARAGWLLSFSSLPAIGAALGAPVVARRVSGPVLVTATVALTGAAYVGLVVAPVGLAYLWMLLMGLGQGAAISLALTFIVARSRCPTQTARLSTMAQSVGYLIASLGPLGMGALHAATGGWTLPLSLLVVLLLPELLAGVAASRDRLVP